MDEESFGRGGNGLLPRWRPVRTGLGTALVLTVGLGTMFQTFPDLFPDGGAWWVVALSMLGSGLTASAQVLLDRHPRAFEGARERAVRRRLPATVEHFIGHTDLMAEVRAAFSRFPRRRTRRLSRRRGAGPLIIAVTGEGGTGKSQFVSQVVAEVGDRFPDGEMEFELYGSVSRHARRGDSDDAPSVHRVPRRSSEILAQMLTAIGVRVPDGASLDELSGSWKTATERRRLLLVLDNAKDYEQVEPLLPVGPGCAVLITSRTDLHGTPGHMMLRRMGPLSPEEGLLLLNRLTAGRPRTPSAADREALPGLVAACHGFPLALCLVGAQIAQDNGPGAADLLRRMGDREGFPAVSGLQAVVRSLAFGLRQCTGEERLLLSRLAGVGATTFTAWAAAALMDVSEERAALILERLGHRYLVTFMYRAGGFERFQLHEHVRETLVTAGPRMLGVPEAELPDWSRDGLERAVRRLLRAYTLIAEEAARRAAPHEWGFGPEPLRPGAPGSPEARNPSGVPARPTGAGGPAVNAGPLPRFPAVDPLAWLESEQRGFETCFRWTRPETLPARDVERREIAGYGWRLRRAFSLLCRTGRVRWEAMREAAGEATALALATDDPVACAIALLDRAEVAGGHGDHDTGHELAVTASTVLESLDDPGAVDPRWRARAHRAVGVNLYRRGDLDDGRAEIDEAVRIFTAHRDVWWLVRSLCNLAEVYRFQGHQEEAHRQLSLAREELERSGEAPDQWPRVWLRLGEVLRLRGFALNAWFVLEEGRRQVSETPNGDWYHARYLRSLGQLPTHLLNKQVRVCEQLLDPARERERRRLIAWNRRWREKQEAEVAGLFADGMPDRGVLEKWLGVEEDPDHPRLPSRRLPFLGRRRRERLRDTWQVHDQIDRLRRAERMFTELGDTWGIMRTRLVLGQALMDQDRDRGKEEMLQAAEGFRASGDKWWHARAHRMAAESLRRVERTAEAEASARVAVEGYRGLRHRSGQLRAMKALAQITFPDAPLAAWRIMTQAEYLAREGVRLGTVPAGLLREVRDVLRVMEHGSGSALNVTALRRTAPETDDPVEEPDEGDDPHAPVPA
ncbi:NB-ARC domain-containing protein [Nocardiopsis lambiniae]|uniref:NB-ARC domain-containing protein n=1 Tax=Nocardiopsis lambiniae TaxID=3075539 RepID=A0ABU2M4J8_9ACTN|nr:NB-ARC domain-containing protein [Nocardiopsis sp. DSM 44743]MDT0327557.1 NB-ARC domain-containing protein [Nocardiopsis sp. DSM 44743]